MRRPGPGSGLSRPGSGFTSLQIPAISGDLIYVPGADGVLYALQTSTGAEVWHYTGTAAWGPVIIAGGMVFASDLTNTFYAFQPQTAAIGPAVTALSITYAPNNAAVSVNLTGSGFFAGGTASAVESVYLDDSAGTLLTGYTVTSDQTIAGAVIPAGVAPGVYHIKVQTTVGPSVNEPTFQVEAANSLYISTLGHSTGPLEFGTNLPFQRHLVRTSNGTLVAVYIGPDGGEPQYPTYNFSFDGGLTWSGQGQLVLSNQGTVTYNPTTSIWIDAQDQIDISSIQWPTYNSAFQKYAINALGVLSEDPGFPVYPSGGTADLPGPLVGEPGGRLWLALGNGGTVTGYYSDNGGLNWNATAQINQKAGTSPAMVLYQGYPAVIYSDGGSLAWSAWNGQSWSVPQILPGPITGVGQSMSAVVTSSGQVNLVYSPSAGGVYYTQYSGQAWSLPVALDAAGTSPSLTTDGTNLWAFYANSSGNLVYRRTSSGQWNSAVAVTNDGNRNTAPTTLSLSPGGQVPVVWTSGSSSTGYQVKAAVIPVSLGGTTPANPFSQIGIFRPPVSVGGAPGIFTLNESGSYVFTGPPSDITTQFGLAGDYPVAGDWDGSGIIRLGVFRCPAPGAGACSWYLDQNNNGVWDGTFGGDITFQFGLPGDIPVVGDWNGTGVSKVGVMRCPTGPGVCTWILDVQNVRSPNSSTFLIDSYGLAGDQPAVGNWAGTGGSHPVDQIGVFRSGLWILNSSGSGSWLPTDTQYSYGLPGDAAVTGNWEGASNKRIGVFRCPAGAPGSAVCQWILNTSGSGAFSATDPITSYGLAGDKPVVGFWTIP